MCRQRRFRRGVVHVIVQVQRCTCDEVQRWRC